MRTLHWQPPEVFYRNIHRKALVLESLFKKVADLEETPETPSGDRPSSEYSEYLNNTHFEKHLRTDASNS